MGPTRYGDQLKAAIHTTLFGRNLVTFASTTSTNTVAKNLAREGAPEGTVVVADEQTAGRGRLGRRWLAPPGTCLLCSVLFRPQLPLAQAHQCSMVCALAASDAVRAVSGLRVELKWPNDLIVPASSSGSSPPRWRKLAGLLTETGVAGEQLEFAVIGIGINVNVPPFTLPSLAEDATSILAEVGEPVERAALLGALLAGIERRYGALCEGEGPHVEWTARLLTLGREVRANTATGVLVGLAESVDATGALLLRTPDGILHTLAAGDVTLRTDTQAGE